jgi:hypothetical protein
VRRSAQRLSRRKPGKHSVPATDSLQMSQP